MNQPLYEIERHDHNWDRRFGVAVSPSGETHVADLLGPGVLSFQAVAGNDNFGNWVQVIGSTDLPKTVGSTKYDFHNIAVESSSYNGSYYIQIAFGESAGLATELAAYRYSAHIYLGAAGTPKSNSAPVMVRRQSSATKAWLRCMVPGQNAKTINFFIGLHEYIR